MTEGHRDGSRSRDERSGSGDYMGGTGSAHAPNQIFARLIQVSPRPFGPQDSLSSVSIYTHTWTCTRYITDAYKLYSVDLKRVFPAQGRMSAKVLVQKEPDELKEQTKRG